MFPENLKAYRQAKGLTQEELAIRLHVVWQTVSKREKGLSVLDADLLLRLAEVLEASVSQLLASEVPPEAPADQVAQQLARINEQLAIKNRRAKRVWQVIAGILIAIAVLFLVLIPLNMVAFSAFDDDTQQQVDTASVPAALQEVLP